MAFSPSIIIWLTYAYFIHMIVPGREDYLDSKKAAANYCKHGIRFSDAESVLFDPMALTREDRDAVGEQRFVSLGMDAIGRLLVVVYTYRRNEIRLVSARRATSKERKEYES